MRSQSLTAVRECAVRQEHIKATASIADLIKSSGKKDVETMCILNHWRRTLYRQTTSYCKKEIKRLTGAESKRTKNPYLSNKNQSQVPGSNANPIIPDDEETSETDAHQTKRKRATGTTSEKKKKKINAVRQEQEKEEQLRESNARAEAEAKAKAITTEACRTADDELLEMRRIYNLKMTANNKIKATLNQQQPQQQENQSQSKQSPQQQRKTKRQYARIKSGKR